MSANVGRDLEVWLRRVATRAATSAPQSACRAMGQAGETAVKVILTSSSHPKGTPTPSRPGQPPSLVTGKLRRSVTRTPARSVAPGVAVCMVGPTVIYGPVQEHGATITALRFPVLGNPKVGFFGKQVTLPPRPFMKPTAERLIASGLASQAAAIGWAKVMDF